METKNNQMNVTTWSMVTINGINLGGVTMFCNEGCLHIYNFRGWVGIIVLEDIKNFSSDNPEIDFEVNKFILEQI